MLQTGAAPALPTVIFYHYLKGRRGWNPTLICLTLNMLLNPGLLLDDYFSRVMITLEKMLLASGEEALGRELFLYKGHWEISIMRPQVFQQVLHKIFHQSLLK